VLAVRGRRVAATAVRVAVGLLVGLGALALAGCSDHAAPGTPGVTSVVASFYPLEYVVQRVGGDHVSVTNLTKPGAEPHDLELAPQDVAAMSDADLTVYLAGFQPAVDDAVAGSSTPALDVSDAANLSLSTSDGAVDPHFWLDPMRLADVGDAVASELSDLNPDAAKTFEQNATALRHDLEGLNRTYTQGLSDCTSRLLVTSHAAFGYLADAYGLEQVGLTGLTPETEPTPAELAAVTDFVRQHHVGTIFYETLVSPDVAETVARATGATTAVLDPIEGLTDQSAGSDYLEIMASNLTAIQKGLGCS
jgi:zinc transport system substrate-binding protein